MEYESDQVYNFLTMQIYDKKRLNQPHKNTFPLDKLAQLANHSNSDTYNGQNLANLNKRARAKYMTNSYTVALASLKSPLQKSYNNTVYGCVTTILQKENKLTSTYCKNRWCLVCNRIRTAKLISGYLPQLENIDNKYFVTLTIPNVTGAELRKSIQGMTKTFQVINKSFAYQDNKLVGIRKLECTYNPIRGDFHPHFHLLIQGKENAEILLTDWLKRYPQARIQGQDIRKADNSSVYELFKYFTKIISNKAIYIQPLDIIFQAMRNLRVYQSFGIQMISDEIEELQSELYTDIIKCDKIWTWLEQDWIDFETGELLTGYIPDESLIKIMKNKC